MRISDWSSDVCSSDLVDVDLRQHDLSVGLGDHLLDDRAERLARSAPLGPEVDDDRHGLRALHHIRGEGGIGDVDRHWRRAPALRCLVAPTYRRGYPRPPGHPGPTGRMG